MAASLLSCLQGPGRARGGWGSPRREARGCHLPADQQPPHTPLTVLCLPGKGRSLPSVARQHGRGQGTHSSKPAAPPQAL